MIYLAGSPHVESAETRPLSIPEFAERYRVSTNTVLRWERKGLLKVTRLSHRTGRIFPEDEQRWLQEREQAQVTVRVAAEVESLTKERERVKAHSRNIVAKLRTRYQSRLKAQTTKIEFEARERLRERLQAEREKRVRLVRAEREERARLEGELKARLAQEAEAAARLEAEAKALARITADARLQAEAQARAREQYRPPLLTSEEIAAEIAAPDGLHRMGLSRYLFRRLTGLGIYGLRSLRDSPRRSLLPRVLDKKSLLELRTALATHHGLELDDHGQLSPLVREEVA